MWWECSECGGHVQAPSAPAVCPECGVAGAILMRADPEDLAAGSGDWSRWTSDWQLVPPSREALLGAPAKA